MKNNKHLMALVLAMSITAIVPATSEAAEDIDSAVATTAEETSKENAAANNADSNTENSVSEETSNDSESPVEAETFDDTENPAEAETSDDTENPAEAETSDDTENPAEAETSDDTENSGEVETSNDAENPSEEKEEIVNEENPSDQTTEANTADLFDEEKIKEEGLDLTDVELDERVDGNSDDYEDNISNYTEDTIEVIKRHTEERSEETEENPNVSKLKEEAGNEFAFTMISDTHILPQDMIEDNEAFHIAMNSDRKAFMESEGLLDAALAEITANGSKYIMITGDLTKDGEIFSHQTLARKLKEWKDAEPGRQVLLVPGNHDINNPIYSEDYAAADPQNSPKAEPVTHYEMMGIYKELVWENDEILVGRYDKTEKYQKEVARINKIYEEEHGQAREEKYANLVHGYATYAARLKNAKGEETNGLTIIGMDATENTPEHIKDKDGKGIDGLQTTGGAITYTQMSYILDEIIEANKRNDVVALASHHASLPHFRGQDKLMYQYIIEEWDQPYHAVDGQEKDERIEGKTPHQIFDEYGVNLHFTGHLHVQDIAENKKGEDAALKDSYYDIATGSIITYPAPVRKVTIRNNIDSEDPIITLDIDSKSIGEFTYTEKREKDENGNPVVKKVDSARAHLDQESLTPDLIKNYIRGYIIGKGVTADQIDDKVLKEKLNSFTEDKGINLTEAGYGNKLVNALADLEKDGEKIFDKEMELGSLGNVTFSFDGKGTLTANAKIAGISVPIQTNGIRVENYLNNIIKQVSTNVITETLLEDDTMAILSGLFETTLLDENDEKISLKTTGNTAYKMFLQGDENNPDGSLRRPEFVDKVIAKYSEADNEVLVDMLSQNKTTIDEIAYKYLRQISINGLYGNLFTANTGSRFTQFAVDTAIKAALGTQGLTSNLGNAWDGKLVQSQLQKYTETEGKVSPTDLLIRMVKGDSLNNSASKMLNDKMGLNTLNEDGTYKRLNEVILEVLDTFTNENQEDYINKYFADNDTRLVLNRTGKIENPAVSYDELEDIINFVNNLSEEYKIEGVKLALQRINPETGEYEDVTVSEELQQDLSNIDEVLGQLSKDHKYRDKVVLKTNLSNKIGNQFERASEALVSATNIKKVLENSEDNKEAIENIKDLKDLKDLKDAGLIDEDATIEYQEADSILEEDTELEKDKKVIDKYEYTFRVRENGARVTIEATPIGRIGTKEVKEDDSKDDQPTTPEIPGEEEPTVPEKPVDPETPGEEEPTVPEKPVDPETPGEEEPTVPEKPVDPETPGEEEPTVPEKPVDPETPGEEEPTVPEKPVDPETPGEEEPTVPEKPVDPETPDEEKPIIRESTGLDYRKAILNYLIDMSDIAKLNKDSLKSLTNKATTSKELYNIYQELAYLQALAGNKVLVPTTPVVPVVVETDLSSKDVRVPASSVEISPVETKDIGNDTIYVAKGYKTIDEGFHKKSRLQNNYDRLVKAVAGNKAKVEAAKFLLENTPKTVANVRGNLLALIEKSNKLQDRASIALAELEQILNK